MTDDANSVIKILFDESHGELLRLQELEEDDEADTWMELRKILVEELKWEVDRHLEDAGSLADGVLENGYKVLVLAAPTFPLTSKEVKAITRFVRKGNSVLIANNYESLWHQQKHKYNINELLDSFGLHAEQLLSHPPRKVLSMRPHYLSSAVRRLAINEPTYLKILNDSSHVIATLPETHKPFLAAVEANAGRIVAIGDFSLFGDRCFKQYDNRTLTLNIFHWLSYRYALDCCDASINTEIRYGQTGTFSITLINPNLKERVEHISCFLESDAGALIEKSKLQVRFIPSKGQTQLQWTVEPQQLGSQTLRLTIDFPKETGYSSLFLHPVAQFKCVPDAEIDLVVLSHQGEVQESVETGVPFEVKAVVRWGQDAQKCPLQIELKCPLSSIITEQTEVNCWRLTALDAGNWKLTLKVKETEQQVTRLIHAYPSVQLQIAQVERDILAVLAVEVHHQVSQIRQEFNTDVIKQIPFNLFTPEDQVSRLYSGRTKERLLEALQVAKGDTQEFLPLVDELLLYIAPHYSPQYGCCIPYAPNLAAHLIKKYPLREENIAYNLLCVEGDGDVRYGQMWLEGNLAALLLHEKYGHGFFYTRTTLGRQLAILCRHRLLRRVDYEELRSPYLYSLHQQYGRAIQLLYHSSILLDEGFATWVELTVLQRLRGVLSQTLYRRKEFLFQDMQLELLISRSEYLQKFNPGPGSQYQIMYEILRNIQNYFGSAWGLKCAVQAMIKAADVDWGIAERDGQIQFGLSATQLEELLLAVDEQKDYGAGADSRLKQICRVLENFREQIQEDQERLQCHRTCLHSECPVNKIISEQLEW